MPCETDPRRQSVHFSYSSNCWCRKERTHPFQEPEIVLVRIALRQEKKPGISVICHTFQFSLDCSHCS